MPTTEHRVLQSDLTERLNLVARSQQPRVGRALTELRCTFAGRSVVPDIVFVRRQLLPTDPNGRLAGHFQAAPDLMVEIVSPEQSVYVLIEKLAWCMQNGVQLAWLIDPDAEEVTVFRANGKPEVLPHDGVLDGGTVLPGLRLPAAELFGWLREPS